MIPVPFKTEQAEFRNAYSSYASPYSLVIHGHFHTGKDKLKFNTGYVRSLKSDMDEIRFRAM